MGMIDLKNNNVKFIGDPQKELKKITYASFALFDLKLCMTAKLKQQQIMQLNKI